MYPFPNPSHCPVFSHPFRILFFSKTKKTMLSISVHFIRNKCEALSSSLPATSNVDRRLVGQVGGGMSTLSFCDSGGVHFPLLWCLSLRWVPEQGYAPHMAHRCCLFPCFHSKRIPPRPRQRAGRPTAPMGALLAAPASDPPWTWAGAPAAASASFCPSSKPLPNFFTANVEIGKRQNVFRVFV